MVFDDYPAEKVQDLMAFAKKESSQMSCGILSNALGENPSCSSAVGAASSSREGLPPRPQPSLSNTCKEKTSAAEVSAYPEANGSGKLTEFIEFVGIFFLSFFLFV